MTKRQKFEKTGKMEYEKKKKTQERRRVWGPWRRGKEKANNEEMMNEERQNIEDFGERVEDGYAYGQLLAGPLNLIWMVCLIQVSGAKTCSKF